MAASRAPARVCTHSELWLARDGWWRCEHCEPPAFPQEVLERKQELDVLFEPDEYDRGWGDRHQAA